MSFSCLDLYYAIVIDIADFALCNSFLLILLLHLLLLFLSYYSPFWTLASNTFLLHSFRSLTVVY